MRARLTLEAGDASPSAFDLVPGYPVTLGRSRDNSIVVQDDLASRLHAKLYFEDGRWVVRDFGLNGTKVQNRRITGAVDLSDGAAIQIGESRFRFALVAGSAVANGGDIATRLNGQLPGSASRPLAGGSADRQPTAAVRQPTDRLAATDTANGTSLEHQPVTSEIAASQLKVDELTALCRYMTAAVTTPDPADMIRLALQTILHQTAAKVAGYLSLDPTDPAPRFVMPEQAAVDIKLSRRLTERVRTGKKLVWLFDDTDSGQLQNAGAESLSAFHDAVCLPLAADDGPVAALHVYRTGMPFGEPDVRFIEAVGGYLARGLELLRHRRRLEAENHRLRAAVPTADELIGDSSAMMTLRQQIAKAAPQPFTVLIHGESGSGKELVAQALHRNSNRSGGPLVVVNCAAIAPTLLEAELFGYRRGAFSGADRDHPGLFEQADEGTLFLDEVGELTLECQAKLLRVIEGKAFRQVGGTKDISVDVRVIAATHRDLEKEVKANRFRQDLMFRLRVIHVSAPPLREHAEDVPELARFFLERLSVQCRRSFRLTPAAVRKLQAYHWPGNVRQLRAVLESAAVMGDGDTLDAADLPVTGATEPATAAAADVPPSLDVDELETWAIRKALKQTHGNVSRAAQVLGISRDTLHTKLKKKGIDREALLAEPVASDAD